MIYQTIANGQLSLGLFIMHASTDNDADLAAVRNDLAALRSDVASLISTRARASGRETPPIRSVEAYAIFPRAPSTAVSNRRR